MAETLEYAQAVIKGLASTKCYKCLRVEMRVIDDSKVLYRYCKPLNRFVIIETYNKTSPIDCPNKVNK
jgi:hypothetical protein